MARRASVALRVIRRWVRTDRYALTRPFVQRLDQRGLFWADLWQILDDPDGVRSGGMDDRGREKWLISGTAGGAGRATLVAAIDRGGDGDFSVVFTIFWE